MQAIDGIYVPHSRHRSVWVSAAQDVLLRFEPAQTAGGKSGWYLQDAATGDLRGYMPQGRCQLPAAGGWRRSAATFVTPSEKYPDGIASVK